MLIFRVVKPCGPVGTYLRFGGTYRPHLQGVTLYTVGALGVCPPESCKPCTKLCDVINEVPTVDTCIAIKASSLILISQFVS